MNRVVRQLLLCVVAGVAAAPASTRAAITAPALEVTHADAVRANLGVLVRLEGSFPLGDLVQEPLEIQALVRDGPTGTRFVRFELSVGAFSGTASVLADGLQLEDVAGVIAASEPDAGARLVGLEPGRIDVLLPVAFPSGEAEVQLFLLYRGEVLLSNTFPFQIPGAIP